MTTELAPIPEAAPGALVQLPSPELTREQKDLLKRTIARGTTDDEFALFVEACRRRRVDYFSKLIYPVKRKTRETDERGQDRYVEVMALQSSIDYFRLAAERTGKYAGQLGPFWCGKDGKWLDVWLSPDAPVAAKVGVLRTDFSEPMWSVALWSNYVQTTRDGHPTKFWNAMGPLMLAKCAESLGLRRAFPEDLVGLYTPEEMTQADNAPRLPARAPEKLVDRAKALEATTVARTVVAQPAPSQAATEPDPLTPRYSVASSRGELVEFVLDPLPPFSDWSAEAIGGKNKTLAPLTWSDLWTGGNRAAVDEARKQVGPAAELQRKGAPLIEPVRKLLFCLAHVDAPEDDEHPSEMPSDWFGVEQREGDSA